MPLIPKIDPEQIKKEYFQKYYIDHKNIYVSKYNKKDKEKILKNPDKYNSHWYNFDNPNYKPTYTPVNIKHTNETKPLILSFD